MHASLMTGGQLRGVPATAQGFYQLHAVDELLHAQLRVGLLVSQ